MTIKGSIDPRHAAFCPVCNRERDERRACVCGNERTWAQHLNRCIARLDGRGIANAILAGVAGAHGVDAEETPGYQPRQLAGRRPFYVADQMEADDVQAC